ncbi:hypothetical protein M8C21_019835, partial [Ambrosia artemisiifolia]
MEAKSGFLSFRNQDSNDVLGYLKIKSHYCHEIHHQYLSQWMKKEGVETVSEMLIML